MTTTWGPWVHGEGTEANTVQHRGRVTQVMPNYRETTIFFLKLEKKKIPFGFSYVTFHKGNFLFCSRSQRNSLFKKFVNRKPRATNLLLQPHRKLLVISKEVLDFVP